MRWFYEMRVCLREVSILGITGGEIENVSKNLERKEAVSHHGLQARQTRRLVQLRSMTREPFGTKKKNTDLCFSSVLYLSHWDINVIMASSSNLSRLCCFFAEDSWWIVCLQSSVNVEMSLNVSTTAPKILEKQGKAKANTDIYSVWRLLSH